MKPISCNQEVGDTERLLCSGAPQGPARSALSLMVQASQSLYSNPSCLEHLDVGGLDTGVGLVLLAILTTANFCSPTGYHQTGQNHPSGRSLSV